MSLIGHNVVIIGGSSGMGFATARLAKDKGANVIIASRSSEKLQNAEKQLGNINTISVDISHESEIRDLFVGMEHVDHVFVSAAQPFLGKILETELETFRSEVDQRFWGSLYIVRSAAPKMKQGSITFITGQFSSTPVIGFVADQRLGSRISAHSR
jgi:NAD(P)-dependent dehydrogenase (short-subunit alcohol dehydrogenase family)